MDTTKIEKDFDNLIEQDTNLFLTNGDLQLLQEQKDDVAKIKKFILHKLRETVEDVISYVGSLNEDALTDEEEEHGKAIIYCLEKKYIDE